MKRKLFALLTAAALLAVCASCPTQPPTGSTSSGGTSQSSSSGSSSGEKDKMVGGVWRTVWGVLIIGFIKNIINLQGNVNSYWQNIIMGIILLVVIILQNRTKLFHIRRKPE